jgi:protein-tyrosine phosphatase
MNLFPGIVAIVPLLAGGAEAPKLTGVLNFRDVGGVAASGGSVVRTGILFRSGELNSLTAADLDALASLKIRYIFDLRTNSERAAAPTHWTGNAPEIVPLSVGFAAEEDASAMMKRLFAKGFEPASVTAAMQAVTAQIAVDGAPGIGKILRSIGSGETPAIVHCTAGKDRTGVLAAILLTILGVPKEAVYEDYLRSNAVVAGQIARMRQAAAGKSGLPPALAAMPPESLQILLGVDRSFLDAAFGAIDAKYGSFSAYVSDGLRLAPADLDSLRGRFLEPSSK